MKPIEGYNKLRGGYYTPDKISEFITDWAIRTPVDSVLEPSCGDGSFLSAITKRYSELGANHETIKENVIGIELDDVEAAKSEQYGTTVICNDFFTYYQENIEDQIQFDVIVGNPPFIRYQYFTEEYRKIAFALMNKHGFKPNRLTNIWLPFLVLSCKALKPNGRIGMVIPAELFQVDYAAEARQFLSDFLDWFVAPDGTIASFPLARTIPENFQPLIVPPGKDKYSSTHDEPYRTIIAEADNAFVQAGAYLCVGYGFNDEHIQPKLLAQITNGKPIVVLARTMTQACKKHIVEAGISKYLIFEFFDPTHTKVYGNGWEEIYEGQYWLLDNFMKIW